MKILWLPIWFILLGTSAGALDGKFTVTEKWTCTVTYSDSGSSSVIKSGGTASGTVQVDGDRYTLINTTGADLDGMSDDASINQNGTYYAVSGQPLMYAVAQKGSGLYAVLRIGFFTVLGKLKGEGELPTNAWMDEDYTASGSSLSSLQGSALYKNATGTIIIEVNSTITLKAEGGGGATGFPISVTVGSGGTVSPNLNGITLQDGKTYSVTAKPNAGYTFSSWSGTITANTPTISFVAEPGMMLRADFVPNPFTPVKGTYNGLVVESGGVYPRSSGSLMVTVTDKGTYSGSLLLGGARYSMSGQFDSTGRATASPKAGTAPAMTVNLQLDLSPGIDRMSGTISSAAWTAHVEADRTLFDTKATLPTPAGIYTMVIPGSSSLAALPAGDGYGTVILDSAGNIRFTGSLADGTKITQSSSLSKSGEWPLYVSLNKGQGVLLSRVIFANTGGVEDLTGEGVWVKPAVTGAKYYPAGFSMNITTWGCLFGPSIPGRNLLGLADAQLVLSGGDLAQPLSLALKLDANGKITSANSKQVSLTFNRTAGTFTGKATIPATGNKISFNGVLLQNEEIGSGYFLGPSHSGRVWIGE